MRATSPRTSARSVFVHCDLGGADRASGPHTLKAEVVLHAQLVQQLARACSKLFLCTNSLFLYLGLFFLDNASASFPSPSFAAFK